MKATAQTVIKMTVVKKNGYCPVFEVGDEIVIKKHCFDMGVNRLNKYCYATLADLHPQCNALRKQPVGTKDLFACRDHGFIEIELERMADELYNYERSDVSPCEEP